MEISEVEKEIQRAVARYKTEYADSLKSIDEMIDETLDSGESFKIFWCAEQLRLRLAIVAEHLITLKGIYESRN